jgi:hypothetical protein
VTLAYTVLNQTNTWAVTFFAAVLGTSLLGLVKKDQTSGAYSFDYPNYFHWLFLVIAWLLLLRFIQRSALALSNMYRWNALATSIWECLALTDSDPQYDDLNDTLVEKVDRLMMRWQDPRSSISILWGTLKLMYLLPSVILLGLIVWGILRLPRDLPYWVSLIGFILWTVMELIFFFGWNKGTGQALRGHDANKFLSRFMVTTVTNGEGAKEGVAVKLNSGKNDKRIRFRCIAGAVACGAIFGVFGVLASDQLKTWWEPELSYSAVICAGNPTSVNSHYPDGSTLTWIKITNKSNLDVMEPFKLTINLRGVSAIELVCAIDAGTRDDYAMLTDAGPPWKGDAATATVLWLHKQSSINLNVLTAGKPKDVQVNAARLSRSIKMTPLFQTSTQPD